MLSPHTLESGTLDLAELRRAYDILGIRMSKARLREAMAQWDSDGNGTLDVEEFEMLGA